MPSNTERERERDGSSVEISYYNIQETYSRAPRTIHEFINMKAP